MKPQIIIKTATLAGLLLAGAAFLNADEGSKTSLQFDDPSKPGTLKISLMLADIHITGADTKEITLDADTPLDDGKPRKDGLRSIGGGSAYRVYQKDNVITIDSGDMMGMPRGMADFNITVPKSTSIVLKVVNGGDTVVENISGDVEISNQNGDLRISGVSGGVALDTMNGEIKASLSSVTEGKTYSFASMNGEINLRVPQATKADVRFRAQLGEVLTDFDDKQLVTHLGPSVVVEKGAAPGAVAAPAPAPAPVPALPNAGVRVPNLAHLPKPPFPAFGGQVVIGKLNGGGPEIIATTMRGTITLRKSD